MEFVVTNINEPSLRGDAGSSKKQDALLKRLTDVSFSRWFGAFEREHFGGLTVFAPAKTLARREGSALFAGHAHLRDEAAIEHQLSNGGIYDGNPDELVGANGVFAVVAPQQNGGLSIWTDPAGFYPVHLFQSGKNFVISNNLHMLNEIAKLAGHTLRRAVEPMFYALAYGRNFDRASGLEDVCLTNPRTRYDLSPSGKLTQREYASLVDHYTSDIPYDEAVDTLAAKMTARVNTVLDLGNKTCVDVTAGVDSRVSLAAMLSTGRLDEFGTYNFGMRPNPDRVIPEHLITKFGLTPTDAVVANDVEALSLPERIPLGAYKFCGMRTIDFPDIGPLVLPNLTRISGAFGELARGVAPSKSVWALQKSGGEGYAEGWFGARIAANYFVTDKALEALTTNVAKRANDLIEGGLVGPQVDQVFYTENNTPYHFGIAYRFLNDVRYHLSPLNFFEQIQCTTGLSVKEVRNGKLHLDLIARLGGYDLAMQPFGGFRWQDEFLPPELREEYQGVEKFTSSSKPLSPPITYPKPLDLGEKPLSPKEITLRKLMAEKGLNARFQNAFTYREHLSDLFEKIPSSDRIWDYLDKGEVENLLKKNTDNMLEMADKEHVKFGRIGILANALTWYTSQEKSAPLTTDGSHYNDGSRVDAG
ncbi:hypothetical protein NNA36_16015 [Shimia sp. CNT1-13L.2]|uniref:hypothetical protein n=1 Tax=Shimia sp. CNT1-13L.2 TaxID=2959663 RepID=UPI0020CBFD2B|nr:hypothetical protein [Shimia sp. CNT1-13L.2]MCP9483471.1 hypothetical protein [Shimia sp. CNT1-13L.2]